jgi:hypothetical protein
VGSKLNTYNPADVLVSLAGLHTVTGYADGSFIKIRKDMKPFEKLRTMGGEISRIYMQDDGFRVELSLMQSSTSNNILSMLYNVDIATRIAKFPVIIKDLSGSTTFVSLTSWVEEIPEVELGNTLKERTWVLFCTEATLMVGGNDATSLVEDALMIGTASLPLLKQFLG